MVKIEYTPPSYQIELIEWINHKHGCTKRPRAGLLALDSLNIFPFWTFTVLLGGVSHLHVSGS
jgi:hypothetical protein